MADETLRATLDAAIAEHSEPSTSASAPTPAPSPAATPVAEVPVEAPAQAPAAAPAPSAAPEPAPKPGDGEKPAATGDKPGGEPASEKTSDENTVENNKPPAESRAPKSWKPVNQAKWDKLDPEVRAEIVKRERDMDRGMRESAADRKFASGFRQTVEPFMPRFQAAGVPPEKAIVSLLHIDRVLSSGTPVERAQMMASMIRDYQIDISILDSSLAGDATPDPDAHISQIVQRAVAPLADFVQNQRQAAEQARQRDFERQVQTVESMEADTEKYPFMGMVKEDMADIIELSLKRGVYLSLDEAYNRAVRVNPESSHQMGEMAKRKLAEKADNAANRALNASSSVSGAPSRTMAPGVSANDLRGTIEAAFSQAAGR